MVKEQGEILKPPFSWHEAIRKTKQADLNLTGLNVFVSNWENLDNEIEGLKIKFISITEGDCYGLPKGIYIQTNVMSDSLNDKTENLIMTALNTHFIFKILTNVETPKVELEIPNDFKEKNKIHKDVCIDTSKAIQINSSFSTSEGCKVYEILPVSLNTSVKGMNEFINGKINGSIEIY